MPPCCRLGSLYQSPLWWMPIFLVLVLTRGHDRFNVLMSRRHDVTRCEKKSCLNILCFVLKENMFCTPLSYWFLFHKSVPQCRVALPTWCVWTNPRVLLAIFFPGRSLRHISRNEMYPSQRDVFSETFSRNETCSQRTKSYVPCSRVTFRILESRSVFKSHFPRWCLLSETS